MKITPYRQPIRGRHASENAAAALRLVLANPPPAGSSGGVPERRGSTVRSSDDTVQRGARREIDRRWLSLHVVRAGRCVQRACGSVGKVAGVHLFIFVPSRGIPPAMQYTRVYMRGRSPSETGTVMRSSVANPPAPAVAKQNAASVG